MTRIVEQRIDASEAPPPLLLLWWLGLGVLFRDAISAVQEENHKVPHGARQQSQDDQQQDEPAKGSGDPIASLDLGVHERRRNVGRGVGRTTQLLGFLDASANEVMLLLLLLLRLWLLLSYRSCGMGIGLDDGLEIMLSRAQAAREAL